MFNISITMDCAFCGKKENKSYVYTNVNDIPMYVDELLDIEDDYFCSEGCKINYYEQEV